MLFAVVLLTAMVALGQPKKTSTKEADKKGQQKEDKADAAAEAAPSKAGDDLGEPPPKTPEKADKTRPSPLTPRADEFPDAGAAPSPAEYDRLLGDIAALRARVASLTTTMFKSKLRVLLESEGDDARIVKLAVTLDDGVVFVAPARFAADDEKTVYEHAVSPGHHVLGVEIERVDARGREYKTWQSTKMSLVVPESKTLEALISLEDDSDMAVDFPEDEDGEYELNVKLRARVTE